MSTSSRSRQFDLAGVHETEEWSEVRRHAGHDIEFQIKNTVVDGEYFYKIVASSDRREFIVDERFKPIHFHEFEGMRSLLRRSKFDVEDALITFRCIPSSLASTGELALWLRTLDRRAPAHKALVNIALRTITEYSTRYKTEQTVNELLPLCFVSVLGIGTRAVVALHTSTGDPLQDGCALSGLTRVLFDLPPVHLQLVLDIARQLTLSNQMILSEAFIPTIESQLRAWNSALFFLEATVEMIPKAIHAEMDHAAKICCERFDQIRKPTQRLKKATCPYKPLYDDRLGFQARFARQMLERLSHDERSAMERFRRGKEVGKAGLAVGGIVATGAAVAVASNPVGWAFALGGGVLGLGYAGIKACRKKPGQHHWVDLWLTGKVCLAHAANGGKSSLVWLKLYRSLYRDIPAEKVAKAAYWNFYYGICKELGHCAASFGDLSEPGELPRRPAAEIVLADLAHFAGYAVPSDDNDADAVLLDEVGGDIPAPEELRQAVRDTVRQCAQEQIAHLCNHPCQPLATMAQRYGAGVDASDDSESSGGPLLRGRK